MLTGPGLFIDLSVVHELVQPRLPIKLGADSVADPVASVCPGAEQGTARTQSGGEEDFGGLSGQIEAYILQLRPYYLYIRVVCSALIPLVLRKCCSSGQLRRFSARISGGSLTQGLCLLGSYR
jgi:hypothetical protein